jgi:hypothetical protein
MYGAFVHLAHQITCDYDLFEWDCVGKEIEVCGCGAAQCRGRIRGFAFLDAATQRGLLPLAFDQVLDEWHRQNPTVRVACTTVHVAAGSKRVRIFSFVCTFCA